MPQFSCWWRGHNEVSCTILSRDIWLCHPTHLPSLPSSWQSTASKLLAYGGNSEHWFSSSLWISETWLHFQIFMFNSSLTNLAIVFGFFQESFYDCRVWLYPGLQNSGRTEVFQEIKPKSDKSSFGGDMPAPTWSWAWYNSGMYLIVFMVSCGFLISPLQVQIIHVQRFYLGWTDG